MKSVKEETEKLKEIINLDEKKKEVIYCIFIVLVLLLLTFGDRIATHFISHQPNPNNTSFGGDVISADDYKIDFLTELKIPEILSKIENKETFLLLSSRESCHTCKKYIPLLKKMFDKYDIEAFYLNRTLYDRDNTDYAEFMNIDTRLQRNLQYTPYLMYFENGVLKDELVGSKKQVEVSNFIERNKLENNKI